MNNPIINATRVKVALRVKVDREVRYEVDNNILRHKVEGEVYYAVSNAVYNAIYVEVNSAVYYAVYNATRVTS